MKYEKPLAEQIRYEAEDIITASGGGNIRVEPTEDRNNEQREPIGEQREPIGGQREPIGGQRGM